ncbi:EF hand [Teladorsagia circumcincta]|uniref:Myosin-2 essential light chain n=1 Tax=Teladorsagia circumcincta TaxID=45464 RepID=A0A2G9UT52_TELCI|nr:EF hand [Teladorsagia circumcincta]
MQFAAVSIANGHNVVCVETERGFSVKRTHQMLQARAENVEEALQRLLISSPSTMEQFMHVLTKLEQTTEELDKVREKHTVEEFVEGLSHFDKEGNGLINVAELRHLLTTLGERLTDEEVDQLLAGHNDSHGNVNIADFVRNVMNS